MSVHIIWFCEEIKKHYQYGFHNSPTHHSQYFKVNDIAYIDLDHNVSKISISLIFFSQKVYVCIKYSFVEKKENNINMAGS